MKTLFTFLISVTTFCNGFAQTAIEFNDTDDALLIGPHSMLNLADDISVEVWVKVTDADYETFVSAFDTSGGEYTTGWWLGTNDYGQAWWWLANPDSTNDYDIESTTVISDGNWHHVAGTYSNGIAKVYIDGVMENEVNIWDHDFNIAANVTIGMDSEGYGYEGVVDDVRLWNYERSAAQVTNYKDLCMTGNENGLIATYQFETGSGTVATDLSPNGFHAALVNMSNANWVAGRSCSPNSIHSIGQAFNDLTLDPNPTTGSVNINGLERATTLTVMNAQGQLLLVQKLNPNENSLDLTELAPGLYVLKFTTEKAATVKLLNLQK